MTRVDVAALLAWRSDHPARPLPRDAEQWLLDEVVHLRAGRDEDTARLAELQAEAARLRAEVAEERAAVVAWLRDEYDTDSARNAADEIERGEHRREEK